MGTLYKILIYNSYCVIHVLETIFYKQGCFSTKVVWKHDPEDVYRLENLTEKVQWVNEYHAGQLNSSYSIKADRRINLKKYTCSLLSNSQTLQHTTLEVKCELTSMTFYVET